MPLMPGFTNTVIGNNIKAEVSAGKPHNQAIAIALRKAGKSKKKK